MYHTLMKRAFPHLPPRNSSSQVHAYIMCSQLCFKDRSEQNRKTTHLTVFASVNLMVNQCCSASTAMYALFTHKWPSVCDWSYLRLWRWVIAHIWVTFCRANCNPCAAWLCALASVSGKSADLVNVPWWGITLITAQEDDRSCQP